MPPRPIIDNSKAGLYKTTHPLPSKRHIRLLRLQPQSGATEIECSLELACLDNSPWPCYNCLSYTWGNPLYEELIIDPSQRRNIDEKPRFPVKCNGEVFGVSENLYEALLQLQDHAQNAQTCSWKQETRYWIDAICINQMDLSERSDQVKLMKDIYENAKDVVIWLGPEDKFTLRGLEILEALATVPAERYDGVILGSLDDKEGFAKLGLAEEPLDKWRSFATLFLRSYFSRVWVVQESWASLKPVVLCGTHTLQWSDFMSATDTLQGTNLTQLLIQHMSQALGGEELSADEEMSLKKLNSPAIFGEVTKDISKALTLEKLLSLSRYLEATNPKDHIYGMLGIWQPSNVQLTVAHEALLDVDYTKTVRDIFTTATAVIIFERQDLNILSAVEDFQSNEEGRIELPSWVPDYRVQLESIPLTRDSEGTNEEVRWNTSFGLEWTQPPRLEKPTHILDVEGYFVDVVNEFGPTDLEITENNHFWKFLQLLSDISSTSSSYENQADETFWRVLLKDTSTSLLADHSHQQLFEIFLADKVRDMELKLINYVFEMPVESCVDAFVTDVHRETQKTLTTWYLRVDDSVSLTWSCVKEQIAKSNPSFKGDLLSELLGVYEKLSDNFTLALTAYCQVQKLIEALSSREGNAFVPTWGTVQAIIPEIRDDYYETVATISVTKIRDAVQEMYRSAYIGRRVFRTESGFLGIGPLSLRKGDQVWVVAGVSVPLILRQGESSGKARLVGESYVHGIMKGELHGVHGGNVKCIELE